MKLKYIILSLLILSLSACNHHNNKNKIGNNFINTHIVNFEINNVVTNEKLTLPLSNIKDLYEIKNTILAKNKINIVELSCKNIKSKKCISIAKDIEAVLKCKPSYKAATKEIIDIYYSSTIKKSTKCSINDFQCSHIKNLDKMISY